MEYYSQSGQDEFIDRYVFQGKKSGFFIDIGAYDGITFSNTYMFELKGWTGICVEPIPTRYEECRKSRKSICVHGCIAPESGIQEFTIAKDSDMLSGLTSSLTIDHIKRMEQESVTTETIKVQCYTFNELIKQYSIGHVEFCSIDTEGLELDILRTIDFKKYRPTCFTVEDNNQIFSIWGYMKKHRYRLVERLGGDLIFVDKYHIKNMPKVGFLKSGALKRRAMKSLLSRIRKLF